jgi:hypothetical protein
LVHTQKNGCNFYSQVCICGQGCAFLAHGVGCEKNEEEDEEKKKVEEEEGEEEEEEEEKEEEEPIQEELEKVYRQLF